MARKYGNKKQVNLNPLAYNIGIAGLSGVGKTTLIKNVCEKLVGTDGYIMLDIGRESGHDCITDIASETIGDWEKLEDVLDDIVDNRFTDYEELKVVVFDTLDELFNLAEDEAIRLHNMKNPDKRVDTINSVAGGFGKGLDVCVGLVLDKLWSLKEVGISFIVIMHTKSKDVEDTITGQSYQVITANMMQRYFNAIKTKLDFLGVAYISRDIIAEKTGKKDTVTKKDIMRNKVVSEARRISFRSDDYNLDCKARFSEIVADIPLDADEFITALQDAIIAEHNKSGKSVEDTLKHQEAQEAVKLKEVATQEEQKKQDKQIKKLLSQIVDYMKEYKSDKDKLIPIMEKCRELGYNNPTEITNIDHLNEILTLIK